MRPNIIFPSNSVTHSSSLKCRNNVSHTLSAKSTLRSYERNNNNNQRNYSTWTDPCNKNFNRSSISLRLVIDPSNRSIKPLISSRDHGAVTVFYGFYCFLCQFYAYLHNVIDLNINLYFYFTFISTKLRSDRSPVIDPSTINQSTVIDPLNCCADRFKDCTVRYMGWFSRRCCHRCHSGTSSSPAEGMITLIQKKIIETYRMVCKIPNDLRTVKFAKQIFGRSLRETRTRTAVTSMATPSALSPAP